MPRTLPRRGAFSSVVVREREPDPVAFQRIESSEQREAGDSAFSDLGKALRHVAETLPLLRREADTKVRFAAVRRFLLCRHRIHVLSALLLRRKHVAGVDSWNVDR